MLNYLVESVDRKMQGNGKFQQRDGNKERTDENIRNENTVNEFMCWASQQTILSRGKYQRT